MTVMSRARRKTFGAVVFLALTLFVSAGTVRWLAGWLYLIVLAVSTILPLYGPLQFDEGLIEERMANKPDAKRWDRFFLVLVAVVTFAQLVVPGLDYRWRWSPPLPGWVMWAGFVGVVVGTAGLSWAMWTNRFFSAVIRIQRDRGHQVITGGPYRFVRHPGYAFWMIQAISAPLLFKSLWTYVPNLFLVAMFFVRTALEDAVLKRELEGYEEYARRVRSRVIPGIW